MYTDAAAARRRCKGTTKTGRPCRAWAVWGDDKQLCVRHLRGGRGPERWEERRALQEYVLKTGRCPPVQRNVPNCHCSAYRFPHRPGSGTCRWPDEKPGNAVVELCLAELRRRVWEYEKWHGSVDPDMCSDFPMEATSEQDKCCRIAGLKRYLIKHGAWRDGVGDGGRS